MPHDILFQLRFFLWNFKANCDCDISYGFFMFHSMFSKKNNSRQQSSICWQQVGHVESFF